MPFLNAKFFPQSGCAESVPAHAPGSKWAQTFWHLWVCDLLLANDSPACRESAPQILGHSKMPRSFPSLDAQGPCLRMRRVQSGPKPSDTFKFAIFRLRTTCRLAANLLAKFWAILKCHAQGACLRLRRVQSGPKPFDTFKFAICRLQTTRGLATFFPQSGCAGSVPAHGSGPKWAKTFLHF